MKCIPSIRRRSEPNREPAMLWRCSRLVRRASRACVEAMEARVLLSVGASVTISGVGSPGTVNPGDTITYTETIADIGSVDASGVQFTDCAEPEHDARARFGEAVAHVHPPRI